MASPSSNFPSFKITRFIPTTGLPEYSCANCTSLPSTWRNFDRDFSGSPEQSFPSHIYECYWKYKKHCHTSVFKFVFNVEYKIMIEKISPDDRLCPVSSSTVVKTLKNSRLISQSSIIHYHLGHGLAKPKIASPMKSSPSSLSSSK